MDGTPHPRRLPGCWRCWRGSQIGGLPPPPAGPRGAVARTEQSKHLSDARSCRLGRPPLPEAARGREAFIYLLFLFDFGGLAWEGVRPPRPKPPLPPPGLLCPPLATHLPGRLRPISPPRRVVCGLLVLGVRTPQVREALQPSSPVASSRTLSSPTWEVSHHVEGLRAIGLVQHVQPCGVRMGGPNIITTTPDLERQALSPCSTMLFVPSSAPRAEEAVMGRDWLVER